MGERAGIGRRARAFRRRGLVAGLAGLAAALAARLERAEPAEASHATTGTNFVDRAALHVNQTSNGATGETVLSMAQATTTFIEGHGDAYRAAATLVSGGRYGLHGSIHAPDNTVFVGSSGASGQGIAGVYGVTAGTSPGVRGESTAGTGVFGVAQLRTVGSVLTNPFNVPPPATPAGVAGYSGAQIGVRGESASGTGVYGTSTSGVGTTGVSTNAAGAFGFSANGVGVYGNSLASVGVYGQASQSAGVLGDSPIYGLWGRTNTGLGVRGEATGAGIAVYGTAGPGGFAGYFNGPVYIRGFGVLGSGGGPQAAAGPSAASGPSAPALTVDMFGGATLENGRATVALDEATAAQIDGDYRVFLTEEGESNGLFVADKGPKGFTVREKRGGTSGVQFSYRVVARRRATGRDAVGSGAAPAISIPADVPIPATPPLPTIDPPTLPTIDPAAPTRQGRPGPR